MWNYCHKLASVHKGLKRITRLRSPVLGATYIYTPKVAYYGTDNHICTKQNQNKPDLPAVKRISVNFIKPKHEVDDSKQHYHLAPIDLLLLSFHHIQFGLLFTKPSHINDQKFSIHLFLKSLKESLSLTLVHFYPLAGQLVTEVDKDKHESLVYVDCNKGPGARFLHASLDMTIHDILSPKDVPSVVQSFFDLNEETLNYNGHSKPLLSVQVTELLDGVFLACSVNHCITDGTPYWQFWSIWSEIHRGNGNSHIPESRLPVYTRCFSPFAFPFTHPDEFVRKLETTELRDRIFHLSSESIARLKFKANEESRDCGNNNISSFQALCALVWRSMIRANCLPHDPVVYNYLAANTRERIHPPLPKYSFGNYVQAIATSTTAGELLKNKLGWAALLVHKSVVNMNDKNVRDFVNGWLKSPYFYYHAELHDHNCVTIENSPRFDMYGIDFGLGKAVTFRTGRGNKAIGLVYACPGREGGGVVDLEICLSPESMNALELDEEFLAFIS